jgi:hypothetical protein
MGGSRMRAGVAYAHLALALDGMERAKPSADSAIAADNLLTKSRRDPIYGP